MSFLSLPLSIPCRGRPTHLSVETTDGDKMSAIHSSDANAGQEDQETGERPRGDRKVRTVLGQQNQPREELLTGGGAAADEQHELEDGEEPSVIVQLASRVQDGTRCRIGSLDMCIQGKCQVSGIVPLLLLLSRGGGRSF